MRRINIFVLLCVFIFAMSGSALAADSTTTAKAFFVESKDIGANSNDILVALSLKSADLPASKDVLSRDLSAPIASADDVVDIIKKNCEVDISKDSIVPLRTFKVTGASLDVIISVDLGGAFSTAKASQFVVFFVLLDSDSSKSNAVRANLVSADGAEIDDSIEIPQKFWAGATLDKNTSFDMIAALKSEGSTPADKSTDKSPDITVGESTTVTLDSLSEDVKTKITDVLENAGIDITKILTSSDVTTVNSADLSSDVYDTITSSDKLTETLSNDSVVVFKSDTVVSFGVIKLNNGGYVLQKNTVPAGKTFSDKLVFYFIKLSSLVSKSESKSENTAALAATGNAVKAVLMDEDGNKLSGSLKEGDTFYAVPSEELEADSYAMVAGEEKDSSPSSDVDPVPYDLAEADSTQVSDVDKAFDNTGYTVKEILGVFKATDNAPAIVEAEATVESEFVFFVKVTGSSEKAESATLSATSDLIGSKLLDADKETEATTTSVYAKSTSNLTKDTTYAVVLAEKESKTIGSSSSGCDAGLGLGALAALAILAIRKTR